MNLLLVTVLSLAIGLALGILGGGGSILTVPILVYAIGLESKVAIATSLLVVAVTSAVGSFFYARDGHVKWTTAAVFTPAAMVGAFSGGFAARLIPGQVLLVLFALLMAATAIAMWRDRREPKATGTAFAWPLILLEGAAVGFVTGLVGAGGGFLVVPALVLLGRLTMRDAVGTSLVIIAFKSLAGFVGYLSHVSVDYGLATLVTGAAVAGMLGGVRAADRIPHGALRKAFAGFIAIMAVYMFAQEIPWRWVTFAAEQISWTALIGGALIGVAAALLLLLNGRIAGISGILAGALTSPLPERRWRWWMLSGMLCGGALFVFFAPDAMPTGLPRSGPVLAIAGLLVGYGTQLGSGCTSGHGVCGIARLSMRSLVATGVFTFAGVVTVWFMGGA